MFPFEVAFYISPWYWLQQFHPTSTVVSISQIKTTSFKLWLSLSRGKLYGSEWWSGCATPQPAVRPTAKRHVAQQHECTEVGLLFISHSYCMFFFFLLFLCFFKSGCSHTTDLNQVKISSVLAEVSHFPSCVSFPPAWWMMVWGTWAPCPRQLLLLLQAWGSLGMKTSRRTSATTLSTSCEFAVSCKLPQRITMDGT